MGTHNPMQQSLIDSENAFFRMNVEAERLASFKDWPFDGSAACNPEKMAKAGFFHCPTQQEPDLVKCFVCLKELDGWEPTDDPMQEHRSHASKCPFVTGNRCEEDMKMKDFWKLEAARQTCRATKLIDEIAAEFKQYAKEVRTEMEKLATTNANV